MKKRTETKLKIATIGFLTLSMAMMLFPRQKATTIHEIQFVRNNQQLTNSNTHGAAGQWDYLFEDEETVIQKDTQTSVGTGGQTGGYLAPIDIIHTGDKDTTTEANTINSTGDVIDKDGINEVVIHKDETTSTGSYEGPFGISQEPIWKVIIKDAAINGSIAMLEQTIFPSKDSTTGAIALLPISPRSCITPRGQTIADKDFVLAYQQRDDVSTICNVERRICDDGTLEGSYTQEACQEDIVYEYEKNKDIKSYNQPIVNPLVQPAPASNEGERFGTDGKLYQEKQATSMRATAKTQNTSTDPIVEQTIITKKSCQTPRGDEIDHGKFVKAYKSSVGLVDVPCETQLRLCVDGTLKGNFLHQSCVFQNMTYNDYIAGNTDFTKPTPQDIKGALENHNDTMSHGIRDWVTGIFK